MLSIVLLAMASVAGERHAIADDLALLGTSWAVREIDGGAIPSSVRLTLSFGEPGRVSGRGCNTIVGSARVDGDQLSFGQMGSTMMACLPDLAEQDRRFVSALERTRRAARDGESLTMFDEANRPTLRLVQAASAN